jgi:hypothetical protein
MRRRGENLQKRWLERHNRQVGGPEIVATREDWLTPERRERINRAVAEVELGSVTHALPEASKRGDRCLRLGSSNGTISQPSSSTRLYRAESDFAPLRARRTIPASSSETEHTSRVEALSRAARSPDDEGSSNTIATSADVSITIYCGPFALATCGKTRFLTVAARGSVPNPLSRAR